MAQLKPTKTNEFDALIIGGGLSGLLLANELEATGRNVLLVEANESLGGSIRRHDSLCGPITRGLQFLPATPEMEAGLKLVEKTLGRSIEFETIEAPPITFDSGHFKPFVGFGDLRIGALDEIQNFLSPSFLQLKEPAYTWTELLAERFTGDVKLKTELTRLVIDDEFVIEAWLNGSARVAATEYFFTSSPLRLSQILPDNALSAKNRQKLRRGQYWTTIHLEWFFKQPITTAPNMHVLMGADEAPCLGQFFNSAAGSYSQWISFCPADITDDSEAVAARIKSIKRQIKRAYPTAPENVSFEKISVRPHSHGVCDVELGTQQNWPKTSNLIVTSSFFTPVRDLAGALTSVALALEAVSPLPVTLDESSSSQPTATA